MTSATASSTQEFDQFPRPTGGGGGEALEGGFPATLVRIEAPVTKTDEASGDEITSSKFAWKIDGYPDREQWSFVNPYAYSDRSNFYKVYKALTGKILDKRNPPRVSEMLNKRCILMCTESTKNPGYTRVIGYAPLRQGAQPATTVQKKADETDDLFGDVPF